MGRGIIGESGADRATDKMDKFIQRSKGTPSKMRTLLQQFQDLYPDTWKEELEKTRNEVKPWDPDWKAPGWGEPRQIRQTRDK
jgi:hypothetical protein